MKFSKIMSALIDPYIEKPLSRLYGYQRNTDGTYSIVNKEADIITKVITTIANSSDSLDNVLEKLLVDLSSTRNRSGRKWAKSNLMALCKYIYSGSVINEFGILIPSKFYPEIIPLDICRKAIKKVRQYQKNSK